MFEYEYGYNPEQDLFSVKARLKDSEKPAFFLVLNREEVLGIPLDDLKGSIFVWLCENYGQNPEEKINEFLDEANHCFDSIIKLMIQQHPTTTTPEKPKSKLILPAGY